MSPNIIELHSENNDFQWLETLRRNRHKRHRARAFVVEGVRQINRVLEHGWAVKCFVYPKDRELSRWANGILAASQAETHYSVPFALQAKLSSKHDTSELLAVVAMPEDDLARIPLDTPPLIVVLDRPSNPGNLGTIIRSCDALGVSGVVMSGYAVDLYDPETVAATTGSLFALPVVRLASHGPLLGYLERLRRRFAVQVVGTSAQASAPLYDHDFARPTVLLIGNESDGLSHAYQALCDVMLAIPMQGSATSLNVACATSILLYEVARQRVS